MNRQPILDPRGHYNNQWPAEVPSPGNPSASNPAFTPATDKQLHVLAQILPPDKRWQLNSGLSMTRANMLIQDHCKEWGQLPPTASQEKYLRSCDLWTDGMTRGDANKLIRRLKEL